MSDSAEVVDAVSVERTAEGSASAEVVQVTGVEPPEAMLWRHFRKVGVSLAYSGFVPEPFRGKPDEIMACLAYGHELGLGPMQSLQSLDVIKGKPTMKPEMMRSLIRAAGHSLSRVEATGESVTFHGKRADTGDEETVTFTLNDARDMGLLGKDNWKKMPRAMLTARATAEIARSLFSDVIMGASYTPEEMGDDEPVRSQPAPDDDPFDGLPPHRDPPFRIVTNGNRGAGRVVRAATKLPDVEWAEDPNTGDGEWLCANCAHAVEDHSEIRRGCHVCACKNVWPTAETVGAASPASLTGEAEPAGEDAVEASDPVNATMLGNPSDEGSAPPPTSPSTTASPPVPPGAGSDAEPGGEAAPAAPSGPASPRETPTLEVRQRRAIFAKCKELGIGDDARHALITVITGMRTDSCSDLFRDEAAKVLATLNKIESENCRMEERDGEWVLVALTEAGVKFLDAMGQAMLPRAGKPGSRPRVVEAISDDERGGVI